MHEVDHLAASRLGAHAVVEDIASGRQHEAPHAATTEERRADAGHPLEAYDGVCELFIEPARS